MEWGYVGMGENKAHIATKLEDPHNRTESPGKGKGRKGVGRTY